MKILENLFRFNAADGSSTLEAGYLPEELGTPSPSKVLELLALASMLFLAFVLIRFY